MFQVRPEVRPDRKSLNANRFSLVLHTQPRISYPRELYRHYCVPYLEHMALESRGARCRGGDRWPSLVCTQKHVNIT